MNPQDQNQPQIQQPQIPQQPQQPQNQQPVLSDAQVEDTFIKENAQAMLDEEAANPGSQDPDALEWARNVVNGLPTTSGVAPETEAQAMPIAQQQPGQTIQPTPTEQAASPDGHVLYIDRSQDQQPSPDNNQAQDNGDNNGNSN